MTPLLDRIEAALFDLDGTLVETNIDFPLMRRTVIALAAEEGIETDGLDELDILAAVEEAASRLRARGACAESIGCRERAYEALENIELRHARRTREIPFARELVFHLRERDIKVGVVTRNCRRASEMSLRIVRICPDVIVAREDAREHKPHPQQLHLALAALGVPPERSVMVGDHLMDVSSGRAAGSKTIGILHDSRPRDFFDAVRPDLVVRSLEEVLDAIVGRDR